MSKTIISIMFVIGCAEQIDPIPLDQKLDLCPSSDIHLCEFTLAEAVWGTTIACNSCSFSVERKELSGSSIGKSFLLREEIWLDIKTRPELIRYNSAIVLAHEVGHLYGLKHSEDECNLMYAIGPMRHCGGFEIMGSWFIYEHNSACKDL